MSTLKKVDDLIDSISRDIVDEVAGVASDCALWNDGQYSGPGASQSIYHDGYMIAVLRWYKSMLQDPNGNRWTNPPECKYLE